MAFMFFHRLLQLRDLSLESTDRPLVLAPGAALPPSLTKLFAVESRLAQVPGAPVVLLFSVVCGEAAAGVGKFLVHLCCR